MRFESVYWLIFSFGEQPEIEADREGSNLKHLMAEADADESDTARSNATDWIGHYDR